MTTTMTGHRPDPVHGTGPTLLAFVERQARPALLDIELDGDGRVPMPVDDHAPLHPLPLRADGPLDQVIWPDAHPACSLDRLDQVLAVVAATCVQRYETRSAVNPHRGYPAAHCFHSAQLFLLAGGGAWYLDTSCRGLRQAAGDSGLVPAEAITSDDGAVLAVLVHPGSIPPRYRELRWALGLCEAGHLEELIAQTATALGLDARVVHDFADAALLDAVGSSADADWVPACLIELGTAVAGDAVAGQSSSAATGPSADPVVQFDRAAWVDRSTADRGPHHRPGPSPIAPTTRTTWAETIFQRSAGRGNKGFTPSPRPLAADVAQAVGHAAAGVLGSQDDIDHGGIRALLVVARIDGLAPGTYDIDDAGRLTAVSSRPDMESVQRAFSYPLTQMSVRGCPAALVLVVDHGGQLAAGGARRLRTAQLELGATVQAVGMTMTAHGGFARPARSFDPDVLAAELELPDGQLPGYLALLGVSRFADLVMDLRA